MKNFIPFLLYASKEVKDYGCFSHAHDLSFPTVEKTSSTQRTDRGYKQIVARVNEAKSGIWECLC